MSWQGTFTSVLLIIKKAAKIIAEIIQESADSAIHDVLVYLTDNEYEIKKDNIPLAKEPFDSLMNYDYICRRETDSWPDEE